MDHTAEKRLEGVLKKLGISRQQFADGLGISLSSVAMYFTGHHRVRRVVALAADSVFGINATWVMTGKGEPLRRPKDASNKLSQNAIGVAMLYDSLSPERQATAVAIMRALRAEQDVNQTVERKHRKNSA